VVNVLVGGMSLVSGGTATGFAVSGAGDLDDLFTVPPSGPPRVVTATGGFTVSVGGTASGQVNALTQVLPGYRRQLDDLASGLATTLNGAHADGFDLNGRPGGPILGSSGGPITASSITVMFSDPDLIAASSLDTGSGNRDAGNADAIAQLANGTNGIDATYRKMIVELGVQSAVSQRNLGIQSVITTQVDAARDSVAGVNLDEEMTNMLSFQHAYAAAGRLVTAIDETLDVLINRTGVVGR
jgi:flagellar hook-associated protein 1 FlgK